MYTLNDFFCGGGGLAIGFRNAGFNIVGAWDFDKFAIQTYKENVGDHAELKDIMDMSSEDIPKATVWSFGFPCQDLSVAGNQAGMKVECNHCGTSWEMDIDNGVCPTCTGEDFKSANRSGLFFEIMRLLDETRERESRKLPPIILAENVKALRKHLPVLEMEYAKRGYKAYYTLYNSKYWNVPQNRERYFVIGIREDISATFEFPEEQRDYVPKLSSIKEASVDEKYYISDDKAEAIIKQALTRLKELGEVHATLTPGRLEKRQNGRRAKEDEEPMFTLTSQDVHGIIELAKEELEGEVKLKMMGLLDMKGNESIRRVYDPDGIAPTLTASQGGHRQPKIFDFQRHRVRKLTPTEYGRCQGFPMDGWNQVVSDSQAYKQFGNAVTTTVAQAIATSISGFLDTNYKGGK